MILLLFFAFISGIVTIAAPCIWPLLPIILSSSTIGGHRRPLGITLGVILSFAVFTLTISYIVMALHLDPNVLRLVAVVIIGLLGIMMIFPPLLAYLEIFVSRLSGIFGGNTQNTKKSGFAGGFVTGLALGIVWSPCAGPILATIAALASTQKVSIEAVLVTLAYSLGVGVPLLIFSYAGSALFTRSRFLNKYTGRIQQVFGLIMILTAAAIYTNYDKVIQTNLLNAFPALSAATTSFETNKQVKKQLDILKGHSQQSTTVTQSNLEGDDSVLLGHAMPEFTGITHWLNTDHALTASELKGKVILIDFWTYTCINCIRTLPFVTKWYDKYHDQGFVVIGVHTPEFEFEKDTGNVTNAIMQYGIHYPVAQDNAYGTWGAYNNEYWPAEYLIDSQGIVRHAHYGEGKYDETEKDIQTLLKEKGAKVNNSLVSAQDQTPHTQLTPETYLGSTRRQGLVSPEIVTGGKQTFSLQGSLSRDTFAFGGTWDVEDAMVKATNNSVLEYEFTADKVYLVITPATAKDTIKVMLDSKPVDASNSGADVKNGILSTDNPRLYNLIDLHGKAGEHKLRLEFQTDGTSLYSFTFG